MIFLMGSDIYINKVLQLSLMNSLLPSFNCINDNLFTNLMVLFLYSLSLILVLLFLCVCVCSNYYTF